LIYSLKPLAHTEMQTAKFVKMNSNFSTDCWPLWKNCQKPKDYKIAWEMPLINTKNEEKNLFISLDFKKWLEDKFKGTTKF